ncbi:hypothetical protein [Streptomyces sp. HPF1205]|uniref:hypothetical protein n=1 Tax=Streptomyces sp. HPF1205 TaxID=2873262 RepID=UPI001CED28BD|nr:hypothetical protein [Streptomyces sp. HPF1205]
MRVRRAVVALLCAGALAGCTSGGGGPGDAKGAAVPVWQPADQGLIAWDYDPSGAGATWNPTARTNGYLFLTAVLLRSPATLTHVLYGLSGAQPTGLTPGQNLIGLYSSTGRLLARTADQTPLWSSPEHQRVNEVPWTTPYHAAAGRYYVVFLCNGVTSGLNFKASGAGMTADAGAPPGRMRYSMIRAAATTLPPAVDLARQVVPLPFNSQWIGLN